MKLFLTTFFLLIPTLTLHSDDVFRIEIGKDYHKYSHGDLQKRVWELERAVWQLQQRVYNIETSAKPTQDTWVCTISTMGNSYSGTGPTKATASLKAVENCKASRGDGFFCKDPKCEQ